MSAEIINGRQLAAQIRENVAERSKAFFSKSGRKPGLATILIGDDPASVTYVRSKHKACSQVNIKAIDYRLPDNVTSEEVRRLLGRLNDDPKVDGILVQLPLPEHLNADRLLYSISPLKDVDGFHPENIGLLASSNETPYFIPCTPAGCLHLVKSTDCKIEGAQAVVVGRSKIVGLPMALLLLRHNATVTIVHSRTDNPAAVIKTADILVVAVGKPEYINASMVKPGAVVIDVGINRIKDPAAPKGYRLVGDIHFESVQEVASWITPVPGGVGPMTIAMLLHNTVLAAEKSSRSG